MGHGVRGIITSYGTGKIISDKLSTLTGRTTTTHCLRLGPTRVVSSRWLDKAVPWDISRGVRGPGPGEKSGYIMTGCLGQGLGHGPRPGQREGV